MGWRKISALIPMFLAMYLSVSQFFVREDLVSKVFIIFYFWIYVKFLDIFCLSFFLGATSRMDCSTSQVARQSEKSL